MLKPLDKGHYFWISNTTIGLAAIWVGMYMRSTYPDISPGMALPLFIIEYLPHTLGGWFYTLLISIVGTGAGLVLELALCLARIFIKS